MKKIRKEGNSYISVSIDGDRIVSCKILKEFNKCFVKVSHRTERLRADVFASTFDIHQCLLDFPLDVTLEDSGKVTIELVDVNKGEVISILEVVRDPSIKEFHDALIESTSKTKINSKIKKNKQHTLEVIETSERINKESFLERIKKST